MQDIGSSQPEELKAFSARFRSETLEAFKGICRNQNKQYTNLIILTDGYIGEKTSNTFKPMLTVLCSNGAPIETVKNDGWGNIIKIQD